MDTALTEQLKNQSNPFSNSRVDTPFQQHPDWEDIYHNEFEILKSVIRDIKQDSREAFAREQDNRLRDCKGRT